jgi:alpha/beta superfamily hydrolase
MGNICKQYKELSNVLLKPNRIPYDPEYDLYQTESPVKGVPIIRHDYQVENDDKHTLICHLLYPETVNKEPINLVCFLHTRGGNALEGKFLINAMLPNVAVLLFNFAGSGLSGGEYVSLGMNETRDFKLVLDEAKKVIPVGRVALWGRSMGAVTTLMFTKLWNNPQKFFVSKDEYRKKNKGEYEKYLKKKEKEQNEQMKKDMEGEGENEGKIEPKEGEEVDLNDDISADLDMENDLLMSVSGKDARIFK